MSHLNVTAKRRCGSALHALDELVARECEAVQVIAKAAMTPASPTKERPLSAEDEAFVEGAVAYLSTRPNAADLMSNIDARWRAPKAASASTPSLDSAEGQPGPVSNAMQAEEGAAPETGP